MKSFYYFSLLLLLVACVALPEKRMSWTKELQAKSDNLEMAKYAPEEIAAANASLIEATNYYKKDNGKSKKALEIAQSNYDAALDKGIPIMYSNKAQENSQAKSQADKIKTGVASKDKYLEAQALFQKSEALKLDATAPITINTNKPKNEKEQEEIWATSSSNAQVRREKLLEASELLVQATKKLEEAKAEAQAKKDKSDASLKASLDDLNEASDSAKKLQPATKPGKTKPGKK
jgi:hypothetical protein